MSKSQTKVTLNNTLVESKINYLSMFSDDFTRSQIARGHCYTADNALTWVLRQVADMVAELDEATEDMRTGTESIKLMRLEQRLERAQQQATELRAELEASIEVHTAFKLPSQEAYQPKAK